MDTGVQLPNLKAIISRRKKGFWAVFIIIFLAGGITAIALPPIYKSEAIIQVEEQKIPEGYVQSTIPDYMEERIAKINQNVLHRDNLLKIAEQFNLYAGDKDKISSNQIVKKMRQAIILEPIVSDLQPQINGRERSFNIAFALSYQGKDPQSVMKVTERLSNLFLEEDIKRREKVVSATNEFLQSEQERLKSEISAQEKKISEFKNEHLSELPDERGYNIQAILALQRDLDNGESRLRLLKEKEMLLNTELARVEPLSPIIVEGENVATNPNQRLKQLYLELTRLRSVYSEKHPDIKKVKNEIKELETQVKSSDSSILKVKRLEQLEEQLAEKQGTYGPNHPEIIAIKREISTLKPEVASLMTETVKTKISEEKPDNPAYINLVTQINAIKMEMEAIEADKKQKLQQINEFQKKIEKAPFVEKELNALMRDFDSAQTKYRDISNKLMEARVSGELEDSQQTDRVGIASSAYLPSEPFKPNRLLILVLGLANGFLISCLFVALREGMDNTVRTTEQIKQITGIPVLSSVSYILTKSEKRLRHFKIFGWLFLIIIVGAAGIFFANQYLINMKDLWSVVLERIKMIV
jgi:succinoglycan biosynthesis transport protein ExoP